MLGAGQPEIWGSLPVGVLQLFAVSGRPLGLSYLPKQSTRY